MRRRARRPGGLQPHSSASSRPVAGQFRTALALGHRQVCQLNGKRPPPPFRSRRPQPARPHPGTRPPVRPGSSPSSRRSSASGVQCERVGQVDLEDEGRHEIWGQISTPSARGLRRSADRPPRDRRVPSTVSSAVQVMGRPTWRCSSNMSSSAITPPGRRATTPRPASRTGRSRARELVQVGHPGGHRATAVTVVGRRSAGGEARWPRPPCLGHHRLHPVQLLGGGRPLVGLLAHYVEPHGGVAHVAAVVECDPRRRRRRRGTGGRSRTRPRARRRPGCRSSCPRRVARVRASRRHSAARMGAMEKPQLPATTVVTPWKDDGVSADPRRPGRRSGCGCR